MNIGKAIGIVRKQRNISITDLANMIHVNVQEIIDMEGMSSIDLDSRLFKKIMEALKASRSEILLQMIEQSDIKDAQWEAFKHLRTVLIEMLEKPTE